jgi:hypothetical protein
MEELGETTRALEVEREARRGAERRVEELTARLAAVEAEKAAAPGAGAGGRAGAEKGDPAAVAARVGELEKEIDAAFDAKDGKAALSCLKELAKLGRPAWPLAAKLITRLEQSINEGNPLGISTNDFYKTAALFGELHADALENPGGYEKEFRLFAAYLLPWSDLENVNDILLRRLIREEDPTVAQAIAQNLADRPDARNVAALLDALEQQRDRDVRIAITESIAAQPGPDATRALEQIVAAESDPDLRKVAETSLAARQAQVAGFLITFVAPNSQAQAGGLREGDILLTYRGVAIDSMETLDRLRASVGPEEVVEVAVWREGRQVAIGVKGGQLGISGRFVRPER